MAEGQLQNQKSGGSEPDAERKPAIRTMRSDVEELFKTTKPSLLQIIGQETTNVPARRTEFKPKKQMGLWFLTAIAVFAVAGAAFYIVPLFRGGQPAPGKTPTPQSFFAVETSRTISTESDNQNLFSRLLGDAYNEHERQGQMKKVLIKIIGGPQERYADISDFFQLDRIPAPKALLSRLSPPLMTFIYYGPEGNRFGLAVKTQDPDRTFADMLQWESSMILDLRPLFFDEKPAGTILPFEDRTYRNIDWRYAKLSQDRDLGIAYTIFPANNLLIITMSKESMETVISRLFDAK